MLNDGLHAAFLSATNAHRADSPAVRRRLIMPGIDAPGKRFYVAVIRIRQEFDAPPSPELRCLGFRVRLDSNTVAFALASPKRTSRQVFVREGMAEGKCLAAESFSSISQAPPRVSAL
jgi:hypothetical protein